MPIPKPTLASIVSLGSGTITNLVAGLGASVIALACAVWQGATLALTIAALGLLLWLLGWAHRKPVGDEGKRPGATFTRLFAIKSKRLRKRLQAVAGVLFIASMVTVGVSAGLGFTKSRREQRQQRETIAGIADSSAAAAQYSQAVLDRMDSELPRIADSQARTIEAMASTNAQLAQQIAVLHEDNTKRRALLIDANRELAELQLAQGKGIDDVLAELRGKSPVELFDSLKAAIADEEAKFVPQLDTLIKFHRALAAIGFPLGRIDEANASLIRVLDLVPNDLDAITRIGHIEELRGNLDEAQRRHTRVLELASDDVWRAIALGNLGLIERMHGKLFAAESFYKQALVINEELDYNEGIAANLCNLGVIYLTLGNLDEAESYLMRSLMIFQELGRSEGITAALGNLGLIEVTRGNLTAAEVYIKLSLAINEKIGRKEGMADAFGNLGAIELTRGNLDEAEAYLKHSLSISQELGNKNGMARQLGNLGNVEQSRGNLDAGEDYLKRSLAISDEFGSMELSANQLGNLGVIELTRGNLAEAEGYHKRAYVIHEELGRKEGMAANLGNLGLIEQTRGNLAAAEEYHKRALAINEELGSKEGMANQLGNLGSVAKQRGDVAGARELWTRSRDLYREIGVPHMVDQVQSWLDQLPPS